MGLILKFPTVNLELPPSACIRKPDYSSLKKNIFFHIINVEMKDNWSWISGSVTVILLSFHWWLQCDYHSSSHHSHIRDREKEKGRRIRAAGVLSMYFMETCDAKQDKTKTKTTLRTLVLIISLSMSHWPELGQVATPRCKGGGKAGIEIFCDWLNQYQPPPGAGWGEEMDVGDPANISVIPISWKAECGVVKEYRS